MINTISERQPLTFGEFIAGGYRAWDKRKAQGLIRLALKAGIVEFRGEQRIVIA